MLLPAGVVLYSLYTLCCYSGLPTVFNDLPISAQRRLACLQIPPKTNLFLGRAPIKSSYFGVKWHVTWGSILRNTSSSVPIFLATDLASDTDIYMVLMKTYPCMNDVYIVWSECCNRSASILQKGQVQREAWRQLPIPCICRGLGSNSSRCLCLAATGQWLQMKHHGRTQSITESLIMSMECLNLTIFNALKE